LIDFFDWIRNISTVVKCGAGEEKKISGQIVSEMGCYKRVKEERNVQQQKKANWIGRICLELPSTTRH
jgi:hypothetical protein